VREGASLFKALSSLTRTTLLSPQPTHTTHRVLLPSCDLLPLSSLASRFSPPPPANQGSAREGERRWSVRAGRRRRSRRRGWADAHVEGAGEQQAPGAEAPRDRRQDLRRPARARRVQATQALRQQRGAQGALQRGGMDRGARRHHLPQGNAHPTLLPALLFPMPTAPADSVPSLLRRRGFAATRFS
jgi:hypothetical protein